MNEAPIEIMVLRVAHLSAAFNVVRVYGHDSTDMSRYYALTLWPTNYAIQRGDYMSQVGGEVVWAPIRAGASRIVRLAAVSDPEPIIAGVIQ